MVMDGLVACRVFFFLPINSQLLVSGSSIPQMLLSCRVEEVPSLCPCLRFPFRIGFLPFSDLNSTDSSSSLILVSSLPFSPFLSFPFLSLLSIPTSVVFLPFLTPTLLALFASAFPLLSFFPQVSVYLQPS
ncbi:hypothetical protein BKA65DRAFT_208802 [Rhexocercosporidium sp. MPI-PUGE-AT-0058]|nr:hypothetical protein BKA65DRAFT_208802 [Rhexocercosporidium sp. MPI-PUGE-AT-0058]